ncbi:FprA family A-type flavoprotein [Athalassotoga saccharophila]|uniref:Flavodoxin n=1 Tax=Athalassotoga saccharophila TaxID=1441386 RepID=A0A6N4TD39_9BACT|nr:FprA family A-type flavoprotein [Athalassotoga saccharophila]BBJ29116.1 flavodoxin [Athalassotoga saccharophila]
MSVQKIKEDVFSLRANDWDRTLFDELIPLPDGTSYNAYVVKGKNKIVLIDTVDPRKTKELIDDLKSLDLHRIDYIVSQHSEQDHSGSIPEILKMYPMAEVVTNKKGKEFLTELVKVPEDKFLVIEDMGTIDIGGKTLKFIFTPWVHWPETFSTYLEEDKILFTCDFFGSHIATNDLFATNEGKVMEAAKRYYSEIMVPFRTSIRSNLQKIKDFDFEIIAPSHGCIYQNPKMITDAYSDWSSDDVKNTVVIPYLSMHGSIQKFVDRFVRKLQEKGIDARPFDVVTADIGNMAMALIDAATIVIASPTMLSGVHPKIAYVAYLANVLRPKAKFASVIGSYDWGGREVDVLSGLLGNLKVEMIPPVLIKGDGREEDLKGIDDLAERISQKHRSINL